MRGRVFFTGFRDGDYVGHADIYLCGWQFSHCNGFDHSKHLWFVVSTFLKQNPIHKAAVP